MTQSFAISTPLPRGRVLQNWYVRLACAAGLTGLADWLFYDHPAGISFALIVLAIAACSILLAARTGTVNNGHKAVILLALALVPAIETFNTLTFLIALAGLLAFVMLVRSAKPPGLDDLAVSALQLLWITPLKLAVDLFRFNRLFNPVSRLRISRTVWLTWTMPLLLSAIFLALFTFANPVIEGWLAQIRLPDMPSAIDPVRLIFWAFFGFASWPFLTPVIRRWKSKPVAIRSVPVSMHSLDAFSHAPVFRALLMFNLLFALQTMLDVIYLWGHGALPAGVTFSQYAHNGTYALLAAALLSIVFILFVTGEKRALHSDKRIRQLLLIWAAQNLILVISTMKRMHMYIDAYSLTYLRVAALIWMLLVLSGLLLIIWRLLRECSNTWLIRMNLASLALILYAVSLINLPAFIANYNVRNAIQNPGMYLDITYLGDLGPQAVPAIDKAIASGRWLIRPANSDRSYLHHYRLGNTRSARERHRHWRAWGFRQQRLINYLNTNKL